MPARATGSNDAETSTSWQQIEYLTTYIDRTSRAQHPVDRRAPCRARAMARFRRRKENVMADPPRALGTTSPAEPCPAEPPPTGLDVERPDGPPVSDEARRELEKRRRGGDEGDAAG